MKKVYAILVMGTLATACVANPPQGGGPQVTAKPKAKTKQTVAMATPPAPAPVKKVAKAIKKDAPNLKAADLSPLTQTGDPALDDLGQFLASSTTEELQFYQSLYAKSGRFLNLARERLSKPGKPSAEYADRLVHQIVDALFESLKSIKGKGQNHEQRSLQKIRRSFTDFVGFDMIEKFVLGDHYKTASAEQLTKFKDAYRLMLLEAWSLDTLYAWSGNVKIAKLRTFDKYPNDIFVPAIISSKNEHKKIELRLKKRTKGVGVILVDVMVNGVSLLAAQRQDFQSVLNRDGIDKLTDGINQNLNKGKS